MPERTQYKDYTAYALVATSEITTEKVAMDHLFAISNDSPTETIMVTFGYGHGEEGRKFVLYPLEKIENLPLKINRMTYHSLGDSAPFRVMGLVT